jgi:GNAT superfamily N-acetyltransferase
MTFKPLKKENLDDIVQIQKACYMKPFWETKSSFENKLLRYPNGAFAISDENDTVIKGYIFFFPWIRKKEVPLEVETSDQLGENYGGKATPIIPDNPDVMYIHDFALLPEMRGRGLGRKLMELVIRKAKGLKFKYIGLMSVQGSQKFWEKMGFIPIEEHEYGANQIGTYMEFEIKE